VIAPREVFDIRRHVRVIETLFDEVLDRRPGAP